MIDGKLPVRDGAGEVPAWGNLIYKPSLVMSREEHIQQMNTVNGCCLQADMDFTRLKASQEFQEFIGTV